MINTFLLSSFSPSSPPPESWEPKKLPRTTKVTSVDRCIRGGGSPRVDTAVFGDNSNNLLRLYILLLFTNPFHVQLSFDPRTCHVK